MKRTLIGMIFGFIAACLAWGGRNTDKFWLPMKYFGYIEKLVKESDMPMRDGVEILKEMYSQLPKDTTNK